MRTTESKTPAAGGTATDAKKESYSGSPYVYDYTTEKQFCQAILNHISELADDIIGDCSIEPEVAGYAGMIKGLAEALRRAIT